MPIRCLWLLVVLTSVAAGAEVKTDLIPAEELYLFTAGRPVVFTVSHDPAPVEPLSLTWRLYDVDDLVLREGKARIAVGATGAEMALDPLPVGYFEFEVTGQHIGLRRSFVVCPPVRSAGHPRFGVNVAHLNHLVPTRPDLPPKILGAARRLGFSWVRQLVGWWDVNPLPDVWDWHVVDPWVEQCQRLGLEVVGSLFYTPPWASTAPPGVTDRRETYMPRPEAFLTFCETIANRFAGRIECWETWNEPDMEFYWRGRGDHSSHEEILADLVDLSRLAHEGVRRGNPEAKLLAFGATGACPEGITYSPFLKKVLDLGCGEYFDALAVHYGADLARCRELLAAAGAPVEIWITEAGGGDAEFRGGMAAHLRADLVQAVEQWAGGARRIAKFTLWPLGLDTDMALFRPDGTPKPAVVGWVLLNDLTREASCRGVLNVVGCVDRGYAKGVAFETPEGPLTVLWLEFACDAVCTAPIRESEAEVFDPLGRPVEAAVLPEGLRFRLGTLPVFVRATVVSAKGAAVYPTVVTEFEDIHEEDLRFAGFDGPAEEVFRHWQSSSDMNQATDQIIYGVVDGERADSPCLHVQADKTTAWPCLQQTLPVRQVSTPLGEHRRLVYRLTGSVKTQNVSGRGAFIEISYLKADGTRIWPPYCGVMVCGTQPWQRQETIWSEVPAEAHTVAVRCYLGLATGQAWFDDLELRSAIRSEELVYSVTQPASSRE